MIYTLLTGDYVSLAEIEFIGKIKDSPIRETGYTVGLKSGREIFITGDDDELTQSHKELKYAWTSEKTLTHQS